MGQDFHLGDCGGRLLPTAWYWFLSVLHSIISTYTHMREIHTIPVSLSQIGFEECTDTIPDVPLDFLASSLVKAIERMIAGRRAVAMSTKPSMPVAPSTI